MVRPIWKVAATPTFRALSKLADDSEVDNRVGKAAREAERIAKRLAPPPSQPEAQVKNPTGASYPTGIESTRIKKGVWKLFTNRKHGRFLEYGTGRRGAASRQPKPGVAKGYVHGGKPGMRAQPHMRPAAEEARKLMKVFAFWSK